MDTPPRVLTTPGLLGPESTKSPTAEAFTHGQASVLKSSFSDLPYASRPTRRGPTRSVLGLFSKHETASFQMPSLPGRSLSPPAFSKNILVVRPDGATVPASHTFGHLTVADLTVDTSPPGLRMTRSTPNRPAQNPKILDQLEESTFQMALFRLAVKPTPST